ncbi:MAG TPA: hypothetical protein ENN92_00335 [candidate division WWE3 bacterium]|uniref:Xylose isomerase-like TIM barrel domain-containing protein n=1 Tax=candidate division WWE3 bacterium TaxID=2053526 RepID=A0A7C1DHD6_UNCKA|nr:hypothetical protein [candidate division WWE3 bacterium]
MPMKSVFHIHTEGTDFHAQASAEQMKQGIQERLGINDVYAGLHFIDPGRPQERVDIGASLETLKREGITPGVEFNIVRGENGWQLDISPEKIREMKETHGDFLAIASIHAIKAFGYTKETDSEQAPEQTADSMVEMYLEIMEKYGDCLDVIGHPFGYVTTEVKEEHVQKLLQSAVKTGTAIELNLATMGLYNLTDRGHLPSVEQITEWNPILKHPALLVASEANIIIGGDFHGNSALEKSIINGDIDIWGPTAETSQKLAPKDKLTYNALRLIASVKKYFEQNSIPKRRVVNNWSKEEVSEWLNRSAN